MATNISDWIRARLDALREMIGPGEHDPAAGKLEALRHGEQLVYNFKSHPANISKVRRAVEGFCEGTGLDKPAREEVGLVVNEAVANVMRHAYNGDPEQPVQVTVDRFGGGVRVAIRDWGVGKAPDIDHRPEPDPMTPGGLGLMCMKRLMDEVKFVRQPDGMLLELVRTTAGSKIGVGV